MQRCVVRSSTQGGGADGQGFPPAGGASPALGGAMGHARASPRSPGAGVRDMKLMAGSSDAANGGRLQTSTSRLSMRSLSIELLVCPLPIHTVPLPCRLSAPSIDASPLASLGIMGAGASTEGQTAETLTLARTASKGREKYLAAEDVTDLDSAKEEIKRLRGLLTATFDANDNGVVDFGEMKHHVSVENGHHVIDALVATSGPAFAALVGATSNAPETSFDLGFIADQDQDSRAMKDAAGKENDDATFTTAFATARLTYLGDGDVQYKFELVDDTLVSVGTHKDDSDKSGRGAEYSLLEWYGGKLVTACDRTGNVDEVVWNPAPDAGAGKFLIKPVENDGKRVRVLLGDGSKNKGLKTEWSTIKDGKLLIGSTGKERTDDDGNVVHKGEMWIKALDEAFAVTDIDWSTQYGALRAAAQCPHGAGYMIHESGRWSDVHEKWLFFPRKLSRQPYDEVIDEAKCCNLMLACDDDFDASKVIAKPALTFLPLRGCSDFLYVPGTNDSHIFVIRTEETIDGEVGTFCSVIDIAGKVLMPEMLFGKQRKFEGCCLIADFMKTKPAY